jgi:multidrug efflux system outer membrane protein
VRQLTLLPIATAAATLALLAGCISVPPDTTRGAGPDAAKVRIAADITLPQDAWPAEQWWQAYGDPQLNELVARALRDNPTLATAKARLAGARAVVGTEQAGEGAQVGLATGANRQRYSSNGFFPPPLGGAWYNDFSVQARASYDFDWWGKHRALVAAALGETNARLAEGAQAAQTLAASVAQSYFRLQMLWARQDNVNALIAVQRGLIADRQARMAHGLLSQDALQAAQLDLANLQEQAVRYDTDAAREREALRALVGGDADALAALAHFQPAPAANALPRELGLELLARRPDLQAARWRVEAQLGRVTAGELAFRPDINLVGSIGLDAVSLGKLLRYPSRTPLVGATLDLPLFDSGRLKAQLGVARAERDTLVAEYNEAVLNAVRDVAMEGATLQGLERESASHGAALEASARLATNAEARQRRGLADRAAVLQAKQTLLRQRDTDLQLVDARLQTQVALAKALGGGYRAPAIQTASVQNTSKAE